jgi:hypothetical protein
MSPIVEYSLPNIEAWRVHDLRLTVFVDPLAPPEARGERKRWEAVVGKPPENVSSRMFGTEHEENGPFPAGGTLSYKRSPRGAEWFLESVPDPNKLETYFGMSTAVITPFKESMSRWLVDCPSLRRMAFGAALYLVVEDKNEGYRWLSRMLRIEPARLHPVYSGDFLYRINRRRQSHCGVPNLEINRVSTWTWLQLGVRTGEGEQSWLAIPPSVCSLELDINTALDYRTGERYEPFQGPLPRESHIPLFDELIDFAQEIAVKGDVPEPETAVMEDRL